MSDNHKVLRPCTYLWWLLIALTLATYGAARLGLEGSGVIITVLLIALIKGQLIADWYMGLRQVRGFWRPVMSAYLIIVGGLIATAFLLPQG